MRKLIFDGGQIQADFLAGDKDTEVLTALNTPTEQVLKEGDDRRPGYSSNATMGRDLGQSAVATFLLIMKGAIAAEAAKGTQDGDATVELLNSFVQRFNTTPDGIDFSNADIRAQLQLILTAGGMDQPTIDAYLALGYTLISKVQQKHGRDAIQSDIDDLRAVLAQEAADAAEESRRNDIEDVLTQFRDAVIEPHLQDVDKTPADAIQASKDYFNGL